MRTRWLSLLGIAIFGLLALVSFSRLPGEEPKAPQRVKWEYKEVPEDKLAGEGGLAKLGDEGWELLHVDPRLPYVTKTNPNAGPGMPGPGAGVTSIEYTKRVYYFKRPK